MESFFLDYLEYSDMKITRIYGIPSTSMHKTSADLLASCSPRQIRFLEA
jgi:hypothetical protein